MQSSKSSPVVLLLAASEWVSTARLAMALADCGCCVELVGKRSHPALATKAVSKMWRYDPLRPLRTLQAAIEASGAAALVAVDEVMVGHLEELWNEAAHGSELRALIERATGGAPAMQAARQRMVLLDAAAAAGVRVPETVAVSSEAELQDALGALGVPLVLKSDASSGGRGVRVASDLAEAEAAWRALHRPPGLVRAVKRGVVCREWTHLRPWARGETRGVTAQQFLAGGERTAMAMCKDGEVLALVCLEVLETWKLRGPSSVVRVLRDEVMERAVRSVAAAVGVSGFCGFDFMIDSATGEPLLIEMNLRPTQLAHLPLGASRDLVAAFVRAVVSLEVADRPAATAGDMVALFPQELQRDSASEWLPRAFHDVPWCEPALVRLALKAGTGPHALREAVADEMLGGGRPDGTPWPGDVAAERQFAR